MISPLILVMLLVSGLVILRINSSRMDNDQNRTEIVSSRKARASHRASEEPTFMAVRIAPCDQACGAARSLSGQRFLVAEAPITPLNDCGSSKCSCRYVRYSDRRSGEERRDTLGMESKYRLMRGEDDRRCRRWGRRAADMQPDFDNLVQHVRFS